MPATPAMAAAPRMVTRKRSSPPARSPLSHRAERPFHANGAAPMKPMTNPRNPAESVIDVRRDW
jgi:hypothetical protein